MERIEPSRFAAEVSQRLEFLIDRYYIDGPENNNLLLPGVFYRCPGLLILVEAARFGPAHHVAWKSHTMAAMQHTLDDKATCLSRLMPVLLGPQALDLARELTQRPFRRPAGIKWKYA